MPKPIINNEQKTIQKFSPELTYTQKCQFKTSELALRNKRPQKYLDLLTKLDSEDINISEDLCEKLVKELQNIAPDVSMDESFLGVLGKCHLGANYDVHTLSKQMIFGIDEVTHNFGYGRMILKHFQYGESLPSELEKARSLAGNPSYLFVEVYTDKLIAIQPDGAVAIIRE